MARKVELAEVNQQNFRPRKATVSIFAGILHQLCPRCRMGSIFRSSIFRGFPPMRESCPVCRLKFEREQGYFLGAMYISYGLALFIIAVFATGLWALTGWRLEKLVVASLVPFVPLTPTISRLSRILWIYLDQSLDPDSSR
jgi:uncharacterized protein (DUF983 family)